MKGVVAFVDVKDDNLTNESLRKKIEAMGGKVVKQAKTKTVTHFVFLNGKDSTASVAQGFEKPLVSPKWIIECEHQNKLLDCKNEEFVAVPPKKKVKETTVAKKRLKSEEKEAPPNKKRKSDTGKSKPNDKKAKEGESKKKTAKSNSVEVRKKMKDTDVYDSEECIEYDREEEEEVPSEEGKKNNLSHILKKRKAKFIVENSMLESEKKEEILDYISKSNHINPCTVDEEYEGQVFTHLIVPDNYKGRTIKTLFAVAFGAHVVTMKWLTDNYANEKIDNEEPYLAEKWRIPCSKARSANKLQKQKIIKADDGSPTIPQCLFSNIKISAAGDTKVTTNLLKALCEACGATWVKAIRSANYCIVGENAPQNIFKYHSTIFVKEDWLLDSIEKYEKQNESLGDYEVTLSKQQKTCRSEPKASVPNSKAKNKAKPAKKDNITNKNEKKEESDEKKYLAPDNATDDDETDIEE